MIYLKLIIETLLVQKLHTPLFVKQDNNLNEKNFSSYSEELSSEKLNTFLSFVSRILTVIETGHFIAS